MITSRFICDIYDCKVSGSPADYVLLEFFASTAKTEGTTLLKACQASLGTASAHTIDLVNV